MSGDNQALVSEQDELGTLARVQIDSSIYCLVAIFKTAYWFTDKFYVFLARGSEPDFITVELRPKEDNPDFDLERSCREFCNSLVDQQVRQDVIQETGEVRDTLLRKAFGEGQKHANPDLLVEDNSNIPTSDMHYPDDPLKVGKLTGES